MDMINSSSSRKSKRAIVVIMILISTMFGMLAIASDNAMALTLSIDDDSITTDDGSISGVKVSLSGEITWDGAENEPGETEVRVQVKQDGSWTQVGEEKEVDLSGKAGKFSYDFNSLDILDDTDYDKSDFTSGVDGASKETEIEFRIVAEPDGDLNGNGNNGQLISSTETAVLTVSNEESTNSFGGSGSLNGIGSNAEP